MDIQHSLDDTRKTLPKGKYILAFNISNSRSVKRLRPFAVEARRQGHSILILATSIEVDCNPLEQFGPVFSMSESQMQTLRGIDVVITQDWCLAAPLDTRVVSVPHVFRPRPPHNTDPAVYEPFMVFLAGSDYLLLNQTNLHNFEGRDFEELLASVPQHLHRQAQAATIIPGGYPPIDVLMEYDSLPEKAEKRSILFAPGMRGASTRESYAMLRDILKMLVSEFKDRDIIYSCFPHAQEQVNARYLSEQFSEPNFHFNTSMTNLDMYADSAIAITDTSHTVQTFSFATLRPSIQCVFSGYRKHPVRHGASWLVHSVDQLREVIHNALDNGDDMQDEMKRIRDEYIVEPGLTARYIVDNLDVIVRGDALPEWKVVRRTDKKSAPRTNALSLLVEKKAYQSTWEHRLLLNQVSDAHPELEYRKEIGSLFSSQTTLSRHNNFNLICLCVRKGKMRLLSLAELTPFLGDTAGSPFFLRCCEPDSIDDFDIPKETVRNRFLGYVQAGDDTARTPQQAEAPFLSVEDIFEKHDDFAIIVAVHDYEIRVKTVLDMYYTSKQHGCIFETSHGSNANMIWLVMYGFEPSLRRLSTIEVCEFYAASPDKTYMIWGSGGRYRLMKEKGSLPRKQTMIGFIDNNSAAHGTEVDGHMVYSLEEAMALKPDGVIFAMTHEFVTQVVRQLQDFEGP